MRWGFGHFSLTFYLALHTYTTKKYAWTFFLLKNMWSTAKLNKSYRQPEKRALRGMAIRRRNIALFFHALRVVIIVGWAPLMLLNMCNEDNTKKPRINFSCKLSAEYKKDAVGKKLKKIKKGSWRWWIFQKCEI